MEGPEARPAADTSTLKPCPFCGGPAQMGQIMALKAQGLKPESQGWVVGCQRCGAVGPPRKIGDEAVKAWNTRNQSGLLVL